MIFDMRLNLNSLMSQFSVRHLKRTKKTAEMGLSDVNKLNMFHFHDQI